MGQTREDAVSTAGLPSPFLGRLKVILRQPGRVSLRCPPASAPAWLAWGLADFCKRPLVWVTDGPRTLEQFASDLAGLAPAEAPAPCVFPARDFRPGAAGRTTTDAGLEGERIEALRQWHGRSGPTVMAVCAQALLQPTVPVQRMLRHARHLRPGDAISPDDLARDLLDYGYGFDADVQRRGEAARRGGILDVWPPVGEWPVRIEFFGDVIESIRSFDPSDQRSVKRLESAILSPAGETTESEGYAWPLEHVPDDAVWVWMEPARIQEQAELFERLARESVPAPVRTTLPRLQAELKARGAPAVHLVSEGETADWEWEGRAIDPIPNLTAEHGFEPGAIEPLRRRLVLDGLERARRGNPVWFVFRTDGAIERFRETYGTGGLPPSVALRKGHVGEGFVVAGGAFTVITEHDLYGRTRAAFPDAPSPRRTPPAPGIRVADWTDMQPGEFVVHVEHGVGRYLGLYEVKVADAVQEVLAVEYADKARLYVPVDQAHLLSRYVGAGRKRPSLHRLGGARWRNEKRAAERAVRDMAASMLRTQALRDTRRGHAFGSDTVWQQEFEKTFPYEETPDQQAAVLAVKQDMESPRPMDRLVCGDVGYGKTEVAMRAAFKAVMEGFQVAILVPTTVLAQQHTATFRERMGAFPVTIDMLSRFRGRKEQQVLLNDLREGSIDIVIGTHRLVQRDIAFKNLGLLIIDEEQRFGVEHKEALKELRHMVDVLTLTATPIPRTLYLGLVGTRDLSVIQTAPRERLPIETVVAPWSEALVRDAILREVSREGQVYYLHNRVHSIHAVQARLARLVPEARIRVAHGQMGARELESIMRGFVDGDFDVLLCTTIIESGLDIPNVNTILIDRADRFGVADLYQLRGRVGRYRRQAHALLLLPRHGRLFDTARKRIRALRRHGGLGAGFQLALQDLEIRGAGNLLGSEQSGHIAAVGFDLYCQLLQRTVKQLRGETLPPVVETRVRLEFLDLSPEGVGAAAAVVPPDYVEDENHRLSLYRRLAGAATSRELRALRRETEDRFGPIPAPLERLLKTVRLRILAQSRGIDSVETRGDRLLLRRGGDWIGPDGRVPRLTADTPDDRLAEIRRILILSRAGSFTSGRPF